MTEQCSYYQRGECRSCDLLPLGNKGAAKHKESKVKTALQHSNPAVAFEPLCVAESPLSSRTKAKIALGGTVTDPILGFFNASASVQALDACPLHGPMINQFITFFHSQICEHQLTPYDIASQRGEVKGLILGCTYDQSALAVRIVLRSRALEEKFKKIRSHFFTFFPPLSVLTLIIQPQHQANFESEHEIFLTENQYIWERYGSCSVALAPQSFFQVTPVIATALYETARRWLSACSIEKILELYCGAGAFSIATAPLSKESLGIDITEQAIAAAKESAHAAQLTHLSFKAHDLEQSCTLPYADTVIVNPPRRGLSSAVLDTLMNMQPQHILYSSCNPDTLARDIQMLAPCYTIVRAQCFDMFPLTSHIETLCLLQKTGISGQN
jgi:23S rRNA (uracil747-C5)-methyltransferase